MRTLCGFAWFEKHGCSRRTSGATCKSRPSGSVSPRRDKQGARLGLLRERSPRRPARRFERASTSPRREGSRLSEIPQVLLFSFSSPRLGEGGLAWASTSRLSETPQPEWGARRDSAAIGCLFMSWWSVLVGYECMMSDMYIMEYVVYVVWFLNYKWWAWHESWHDLYMTCIWWVGYICMCVGSQTWHEQ